MWLYHLYEALLDSPGPLAGALGWAAADPAASVGGGQHVAGIGFT